MKKTVLFVTAALMSLALAACQPTPDSPVVIEKNTDAMIADAKATQTDTQGLMLKQKINAPDSFSCNESEGNLSITSDNAPINVPDTDKIPIINVSATIFSQELVDKYWEELIGGTQMWNRTSQPAKADIEQMIIRQKQLLGEAKQNGNDAAVQACEDYIADLEALYQNAPEKAEVSPADGKLRENYNYDPVFGNIDSRYMGFSASSLKPGEAPGNDFKDLSVSNPWVDGDGKVKSDMSPATLYYQTAALNNNYFERIEIKRYEELRDQIVPFLKITPDEAKEAVESLIAKTGTPMRISNIELISDKNENAGKNTARHYAYQVDCVREINGFSVSDQTVGGADSLWYDGIYTPKVQTEAFTNFWDYERMSISLDDSGIIELFWQGPLEIGPTEVVDCKLLNFDEIASIFKKMAMVSYEPNIVDGYSMVCDVDEVRLELMRVAVQNSDPKYREGMLVPAWTFYGTRTLYNDSGEIVLGEAPGGLDVSKILSVNAVDGSVINMSAGY